MKVMKDSVTAGYLWDIWDMPSAHRFQSTVMFVEGLKSKTIQDMLRLPLQVGGLSCCFKYKLCKACTGTLASKYSICQTENINLCMLTKPANHRLGGSNCDWLFYIQSQYRGGSKVCWMVAVLMLQYVIQELHNELPGFQDGLWQRQTCKSPYYQFNNHQNYIEGYFRYTN